MIDLLSGISLKKRLQGGITEIILFTRSGNEAIENHFDAHYELGHRLEKKGKETILGTVKNIIPDHVTVTSVRQRDTLGLGHAVHCAMHLLKNEPFAVLLPDVLVRDQESRDKNYSFAEMTDVRNETGIGQVMVEGVGGQIQMTDALHELVNLDGLNASETDAGIFDYGIKQVCIYAFSKEQLNFYHRNHAKTRHEDVEDIEILRFLESDYTVDMVKLAVGSIAVDVPSDFDRVVSYIRSNK